MEATATAVRHLPRPVAPPRRSLASDVLLLADRASERFPAVADRVRRGAWLLLAGHVRPVPGSRHLFAVLSQSPSRQRKVYSVSTEELTCSCPDWARAHAPEVKGRRLCKHLFAALLWEATR